MQAVVVDHRIQELQALEAAALVVLAQKIVIVHRELMEQPALVQAVVEVLPPKVIQDQVVVALSLFAITQTRQQPE
jgi:hypothetical protein